MVVGGWRMGMRPGAVKTRIRDRVFSSRAGVVPEALPEDAVLPAVEEVSAPGGGTDMGVAAPAPVEAQPEVVIGADRLASVPLLGPPLVWSWRLAKLPARFHQTSRHVDVIAKDLNDTSLRIDRESQRIGGLERARSEQGAQMELLLNLLEDHREDVMSLVEEHEAAIGELRDGLESQAQSVADLEGIALGQRAEIERQRAEMERQRAEAHTLARRVEGYEASDEQNYEVLYSTSARLADAERRLGIPRPSPVFIHALWRTGSTFVWSRFRARSEYHCYYEPLNEILIGGRREANREYFAAIERAMSHPGLDREYFAEYPILLRGGAPFFLKRFPYDDFCMDADADNPALEKYLRSLAYFAGEKRSVFQFCRSTLRTRWMKGRFGAYDVYVVRSPREQWESGLTVRDWFVPYFFLIAGKNRDKAAIRPLAAALDIPSIEDADIFGERAAYAEVAARYTLEQAYFAFYYTWLLSLVECVDTCDLVLDIDLMTDEPTVVAEVERELAASGIEVDLGGCNCRRYASYTLGEDAMARVEADVLDLVRAALRPSVERDAGRLRFVGRRYHDLLEAVRWRGEGN